MRVEDYEDAIAFFQQALTIDPSHESAQRFLQRCQSHLANRGSMGSQTPAAIHRQVRALISKGTSASNAGDYKAAIRFFEEAIDLDPENEKASRLLTRARREHLQAMGQNPAAAPPPPLQVSPSWERYLDPNTKGYYPAARSVLQKNFPYILEIVKGTHVGILFPLQREKRYSIGRHYQNTIVLPDAGVSGFHALLTLHPQGCGVEDLNSTNGTYINGQRIQQPTWFRSADELQVGRTMLRFVRN
jgi:tetratricopeptide (TPR) repeat protein